MLQSAAVDDGLNKAIVDGIKERKPLTDLARMLADELKPSLEAGALNAKRCEGCEFQWGSQRDHDCLRFDEDRQRTVEVEISKYVENINEMDGFYEGDWFDEFARLTTNILIDEL